MPQQSPQHSERQLSRHYAWIALALAFVAGAVDGIGYLVLNHVFTSHMSGNTVAMTIYVASGRWREWWRHFEPIVVFFGGIAIGFTLTDIMVHLKTTRMFSIVAGCEAALLLAFFFLARPAHQWMVLFPAGAMGIQNAMLRRVGKHRVRTTFVTGMLTNTAQGAIDAIRSLLTRDGKAAANFSDFLFYGGIWLAFAVGGIAGVLLGAASRTGLHAAPDRRVARAHRLRHARSTHAGPGG